MAQEQEYLSHFSEGYRGTEFLATAVTHLLLESLFIPFLIAERVALPVGITLHQKYSKSGIATNPPNSESYCRWSIHELLARASLCTL